MITYLDGKLAAALPTQATVDVGGVGGLARRLLGRGVKGPAQGQRGERNLGPGHGRRVRRNPVRHASRRDLRLPGPDAP